MALKTNVVRAALAAVGIAAVVVAWARPLATAPNYDEEVYLATMRELRHGHAIGDVFLSQPPGFGWFLDGVGLIATSLESVRGVMIGVALLGCLAAWFIGRRAGGPVGGAIAAGTLAIAPAWAVNASRLEAEVPSTTLAVAALALAPRVAFLAGAAFALAVSIKLLAVSVLVPLVLIAHRDWVKLLLGAATASTVIVLSVVTHLGQVWHQAVVFHVNGRKTALPISDNLHRVVRFFDVRTPFAVLAGAAMITAVVLLLSDARFEWALWTWPLLASAALVLERPLIDHHIDVLAAAWAVPIGATLAAGVAQLRGRAQVAAVAFVGLAIAAGLAQQWKHNPAVPPSPDVNAAVARLKTLLPPGSLIATEHQIIAYRAGFDEPPSLVDLSFVRLESGDLTHARLLEEAAGAKAFVIGRALRDDQQLLAALSRRYRRRIVIGSITIFTR
jgi:hypothetical protein